MSCLSNFPIVTFVATLLLCLGVGLFCGSGFRAAEIVNQGIFRGLFKFYVEWIQSVEIGFFVFAIFMALFSIVLLTFSCLASSATRSNLYTGVKCIMGGRITAFLFLVLTFVLKMFWILITSFIGMAIIIYIMLFSICSMEVEKRSYQFLDTEWEFCLNLSRFGIYRNITYGMDMNSLCDESDLGDFCNYVNLAGPQFCVAFAGSFLMVLGLIIFIMELGANYSKIQAAKEITNYQETFALSSTEY